MERDFDVLTGAAPLVLRARVAQSQAEPLALEPAPQAAAGQNQFAAEPELATRRQRIGQP